MNRDDLIRRVDSVIAKSHDDEMAHYWEDELHLSVIHEFCPDWVWTEIKRLRDADFARWYA